MKRVIALVLVSMFVWSSVAAAAGRIMDKLPATKQTVSGKVYKSSDGAYVLSNDPNCDGEDCGNIMIYPEYLKKTTKAFRQCINTKSTVVISGMVKGGYEEEFFLLDKKSTCKRK